MLYLGIGILAVIIFTAGVKIVRPVEVGVVEFLGRYTRTARAGFNWIHAVILPDV